MSVGRPAVFADKVFRQRLSGCNGLFGKAVTGFPVLVAEEKDYKQDKYGQSEDGDDCDNRDQDPSADRVAEVAEGKVVVILARRRIHVRCIYADHRHCCVGFIRLGVCLFERVTFTFSVESFSMLLCFVH